MRASYWKPEIKLMPDLNELIKKIAVGAVKAENPVSVFIGTVKDTEPLVVTLDNNFDISEEFLILPEGVLELKLNLKHAHKYIGSLPAGEADRETQDALTEEIAVRDPICKGDHVILLMVQGGQQFIVLDRIPFEELE